ncbi:MAG: DUF1203 domain-containing protein [Kordiimonadaceae bacterium]|nr:DUF1203 domain-containing protein [Kordiimonadaceae bacterium]
MTYQIKGLEADQFRRYFAMSAEELAANSICIHTADDSVPGLPCRVSLNDAPAGERMILLNHHHLPVETPYSSSHAIYVSEGSVTNSFTNEIPPSLKIRLLSVRAFGKDDMMVNADVIEGENVEGLITDFMQDPKVSYVHVHYARPGCFAARVERAE